MNYFNGYECEIAINCAWRIPINLSLKKKKKKNISAVCVVAYCRSFHPHYQQECPMPSITAVFSGLL
jgi:hypothetical protein